MKTTNYELSKKLAEAGFKTESDIAVTKTGRLLHNGFALRKGEYLAYDLETLIDAFPRKLSKGKEMSDYSLMIDVENGLIAYRMICCKQIETWMELAVHRESKKESLADTAARLLLLLHEKGLVKFNKEVKDE